MAKHVIRISQAEAARDFAAPMARVRPAEPHVRLLSESLRLAREHHSSVTLNGDFSKDVQAAIESHREPLNPLV